MTTTLHLIELRDIFTDWETSPALNAAKYHEARQPYAPADALFRKRIVPAELARHLQTDDPSAAVFFVQIKSLPTEVLHHHDFTRWTSSPEYGVVWPANDWPKSTEALMLRSIAWTQNKEEYYARRHEEDRITRMGNAIAQSFPQVKGVIYDALRGTEQESAVALMVSFFEKASGRTIYESPNTTNQTHDISIESPSSHEPLSPSAEQAGAGI